MRAFTSLSVDTVCTSLHRPQLRLGVLRMGEAFYTLSGYKTIPETVHFLIAQW